MSGADKLLAKAMRLEAKAEALRKRGDFKTAGPMFDDAADAYKAVVEGLSGKFDENQHKALLCWRKIVHKKEDVARTTGEFLDEARQA